MSVAYIAQIEANSVDGGSAQGYLSGSDTTTALDTFYGRRLTNLLVNESSGGVPTVNSFTASTGGSGSSSTAGQFTLIPGTYRISGRFIYYVPTSATNVVVGLYNTTSAAFETYAATAVPIIATVTNSSTGATMVAIMEATFTVTTTNKTYEIRHKLGNSTTVGRDHAFCGAGTSQVGANVNGAAATNTYCLIKIVKTA